MSDELLTKENEFYERNGELERKTKELMKQVNSVVNNELFEKEPLYCPDTCASRSVKTSNAKVAEKLTTSKWVPDIVLKDFQSDPNLPVLLSQTRQSANEEKVTNIGSYEDVFEKQCNGTRNNAVVRFFKSKSKILETELEAIKIEYKKKCDYSNQLQAENKKIEEDRVKLHGHLSVLKDSHSKIEASNNVHLINLQRSENENTTLKKEIEVLKKELKVANQNCSSYSMRLNRSCEDNERLRKALKCSKLEEKELRDENRKLEEDKKLVITNLEKQRVELLHAFKKQMLLVDNLKKQKVHLEASMIVKYTEEELLKMLDWKVDSL